MTRCPPAVLLARDRARPFRYFAAGNPSCPPDALMLRSLDDDPRGRSAAAGSPPARRQRRPRTSSSWRSPLPAAGRVVRRHAPLRISTVAATRCDARRKVTFTGHNLVVGYSAPATSRRIPTRGDAHRAVEALHELDAGIVVLYGSVGSGTAQEGSDIDLCLVFDDLGDYSTRMREKDPIVEAASAAVGCPVDVFMTDRPEWAVRVGCVSSLERRIADYGIVLKERPAGNVDWDKTVEPPTTDDGYAQDALHHMRRALTDLPVGACVAGLDPGDSR